MPLYGTLDITRDAAHLPTLANLDTEAWTLPKAGGSAWRWLTRLEDRLPPWTARWGAHLECVARRVG